MTAITRKRGDTYDEQFAIRNEATGAAINIAGCSFLLTVDPEKAPTSSANNLFQSTGVIVDATAGTVKFPISSPQADHVGKFFYDVQMTDAEGKKRTVQADKFTFLQDITKT